MQRRKNICYLEFFSGLLFSFALKRSETRTERVDGLPRTAFTAMAAEFNITFLSLLNTFSLSLSLALAFSLSLCFCISALCLSLSYSRLHLLSVSLSVTSPLRCVCVSLSLCLLIFSRDHDSSVDKASWIKVPRGGATEPTWVWFPVAT